MTLFGEIAHGASAGSWTRVAEFAAATIEELTGAECALVTRASADYRQLKLYNADRRIVWHWPGGAIAPIKEGEEKGDERTA